MYKYFILISFFCGWHFSVQGQSIASGEFWPPASHGSFSLQFDNDTYYLTDYYYSQGLIIQYFSPIFNKSPLARIFPKSTHHMELHSGISLSQKLYTPRNIRDTLIQFNDRPFAATLELHHRIEKNDASSGFSCMAEVSLGVIGPAAGGKPLQQKIHDWIDSPEANGWKYQVANDLILNTKIAIDYPLLYQPSFRLAADAALNVGTLYDDVGFGINLAAAKHQFKPLPSKKVGSSKQLIPFVEAFAHLKLVGYNATLQGGMFSSGNAYTLTYEEITPLVLSAGATVGLQWHRVSLSYSHLYLTREFDSGTDHQYGSFRLIVYF